MIAFAALLERLTFTPAPAARRALVGRYLATVPDPDRGFGLAAIAGTLRARWVRPAALRALAVARTDPLLFAWSHDYVGEVVETVALTWPERPVAAPPPCLSAVVAALLSATEAAPETAPRAALLARLADWMDASEPAVRLALLKLVSGGARVPDGGALALAAVAAWSGLDPTAVAEAWHALAPPYLPLLAWASGQAPRPAPSAAPVFRPLARAGPVPPAGLGAIDLAEFRVEWAWDGARVQLVATAAGRRVFSGAGADLSDAYPALIAAMDFDAVLDGVLLAPPAPAEVRLFDLLAEDGVDLRDLPFDARRARLEAWCARAAPSGMALSPLLAFADAAALARLRAAGGPAGSAGLMLKRRDSAYGDGGAWRHWPPAPRVIQAVLMYAERGAAAPYTVGLWDGAALVPVGKAGSALTEAGTQWLDRWIGAHTIARFGPVRDVEKTLVLEVAFDSAAVSARHKAGVVLRGARVVAVRQDAQPAAVGRVAALMEDRGR